MPSTLRSGPQSSIAKPSALLQRKQKMTLSQTYYLAHVARGKLSKEAAKADHDLRLLVGHANLLDGLMLDLADAEREQESWFNQTVKGASAPAAASTTDSASSSASTSSSDRHIRWPETLPSVTEDYEEDSDDNSSDDEAEAPARKAPRPATLTIPSVSAPAVVDDEDEDEDEDMAEDPEEHAEGLRLHRTPSHSSPPELMEGCESESDSESDDMPPSPPAPKMQRSDAFAKPPQDAAAAAATQDAFYEEGFYLPQRQPVAVY